MVYKILLVEDEPTMRRLMAVMLARHGHDVREACDGQEALDFALEFQPDIILLDVMMPGIDGFEALQRLRAQPKVADIPVVFLSAKGQVRDRVDGLRLGADDYVVKPADPEELMARIHAVLQRTQRDARRTPGKVFGFVGAKGGVGTTTLVANMGVHLQRGGRQPLLVDMHLSLGNLASLFGLDASSCSIASLAAIQPGDIDPPAVERLLLQHSSGVRLLASPPDVPSFVTFTGEHLQAIVESAKHSSRDIFLDLPTDPDILELVSAELSGIVLVLSDTHASLQAARQLAAYLGRIGLHDQLSVVLVEQHESKLQFADSGMITQQLGCLYLGEVPFRPDLYLRAEYNQSPLLMEDQKGAVSAVFETIGETLLNYVEIMEEFKKEQVFKAQDLV